MTALTVQEGYKTKTQLQRLAEGNVVQNTPVKKKTIKKENKTKNTNKEKASSKTKQTKLKITKKKKLKQPLKNSSKSRTI